MKFTEFLQAQETKSNIKLIESETGFSITELDFISPDGRTEYPSGSFYDKGEWHHRAERNSRAFTSNIEEGVAKDQYGLSKYRGGVIVFSTDVNAVNRGSGLLGKLKSWADNKLETIKNRYSKDSKLSKLIQKFNSTHNDDLHIGAFSIGNLFNGRYVSGGNVYDEKSASIEILGVPSEVLLLLGTEIANDFKQETVLIKDFNRDKFYLADRTRANPATELQKLK